MKISEIFYSLQGEGRLAGQPSIFIRVAGCPLRCRWCDTKYAWDYRSGTEYSIAEIIKTIRQWQCHFIVITGGEPLINPDLKELTHCLKKLNKHITIETAGITFVQGLKCDLMSISPKLGNSYTSHNHLTPNVQALRKLIRNYEYQFKFVVNSKKDLSDIENNLNKIGAVSLEKIMLMPQAKTRKQLLAKNPMVARLCQQTGYAFCQRLHIILADGKRGV